ncbi:MAG: OmpA family protein [Desulfurivibrionaceae bacterium]
MNKLGRIILLVIVGMITAERGPAVAATNTGDFEISPFVGYHWFDNETDYADDVVWGGRLGYLYNANHEAEFAVAVVPTDLRGSGADADLIQVQLDGLYNFTGLGRLVPYLAAGIGVANYDPEAGSADEYNFLINYGGGARYFFADNLALRLDLRQPVVFDDTDFNLMATVGLSYFFGTAREPVKAAEEVAPPPADSDGDGVSDAEDNCPDTPADVRVNARGCPSDSDGDGVYDYLDQCPDTPDNAPVDTDGCPKDSDGDGLSDWQESQRTGTDPHNPDTDGDHLSDGDEVNRFRTDPLNPDTDGGGVADGLEVNVAKTNPLIKEDDVKEVKRIELEVYFDTDSYVVKPEYYAEIEQVATFLKENPEVEGVVEGHTDNRGSAEYNQELSERRALSVIRVAEERFGVEPGRLTAVGYGGTQPVADNDTAEGRARNRRIEAAFSTR